MKCNNIQLPISSKKYDDNKLYERALKTNTIKAIEIMRDITIPSSVFKYRSFGNYEDEGQQNWKENSHWKDSMNGELFFSTPKDLIVMIQMIVNNILIPMPSNVMTKKNSLNGGMVY